MRILVTGASGFVGAHLVTTLKRDGHEVIRFVRGNTQDTDAFAGPTDLATVAEWPSWPHDIGAVIHLAANNPTAARKNTLTHDNIVGTKILAKRVARERVPLMIFISTANIHAAGLPQSIGEDGPVAPQSAYAQSKLDAEEAFWSELKNSETEGCVLRPAPVYGRDSRGNMSKLVKIAKLPTPLPIKGLGAYRSIVSVDHLVDAIAKCLVADVGGKTYLIADDNPLRPDEIVAALRHGWGRSPMLLPTPAGFLNKLLGQKQGFKALFQTFMLDNSHAKRDLNWHPIGSAEKLAQLARAGQFSHFWQHHLSL